MNNQTVRIDKIIWYIRVSLAGQRSIQPLCPKHHLRMVPVKESYMRLLDQAYKLKCADCKKPYIIPRAFSEERRYVLDKVDAKVFKGMRVLNLDDEAIPIAEEKIPSEGSKFFVTGCLMKSKVGLRLVVYAGEKGKKAKTQIFVEPDIKRLAFDQKDLHPTEVFTELEATFADKTKFSIKKDMKKKRSKKK